MNKLFFTILIAFLFLAVAGCESSRDSVYDPLVIDLSAVARALGRDEVMTRQVEQATLQLNDELTRIGSELEKQLKEKEKQLKATSEQADEETSEQLGRLTLQANLQLKKTRELAGRKAVEFRNGLIAAFRDEVMQAAKSIAADRDAVTVFAANNSLLWYSNSIDITDEVIGVMRAKEKADNDMRVQDGNKGTADAAAME